MAQLLSMLCFRQVDKHLFLVVLWASYTHTCIDADGSLEWHSWEYILPLLPEIILVVLKTQEVSLVGDVVCL